MLATRQILESKMSQNFCYFTRIKMVKSVKAASPRLAAGEPLSDQHLRVALNPHSLTSIHPGRTICLRDCSHFRSLVHLTRVHTPTATIAS